jgi:hypothetical protein
MPVDAKLSALLATVDNWTISRGIDEGMIAAYALGEQRDSLTFSGEETSDMKLPEPN